MGDEEPGFWLGSFWLERPTATPIVFPRVRKRLNARGLRGFSSRQGVRREGPRVRKRLKKKELQGRSGFPEKEKSAQASEPTRVR